MARRIVKSNLSARTIDILNVIRENASYEYQSSIPKVETVHDIPKVGEILQGNAVLSNAFLNALINRIALVRIQSATFNNPYEALKKGYLEFGESVEDIFVGIINAECFDPETAEGREFKRSLPDVRSCFHVMNWRVFYPVTVHDEDLRQAFLSVDGVTDLIGKIVEQVYTSANYDEFLLFKYALIKAVTSGKLYPKSIGDGTDPKKSAVSFRSMSNQLIFMNDKYNEMGVTTSTPKDRQVIFMDADFNAEFDVEVLASAFNMDKADFMGKLYLIDNWTEFNNARFEEIRKHSDGLEEVTAAELELMKNVRAIILDENWFQMYDNNNKFTEKYVSVGLYWNYFYHTWKTVSHSPFANAVVFVTDAANIAVPETLTAEIKSKDISDAGTVFTFDATADGATLQPSSYTFLQTEPLTKAGIAVDRYGALTIPAEKAATEVTLKARIGSVEYTGQTTINAASTVGTTVTMTKA